MPYLSISLDAFVESVTRGYVTPQDLRDPSVRVADGGHLAPGALAVFWSKGPLVLPFSAPRGVVGGRPLLLLELVTEGIGGDWRDREARLECSVLRSFNVEASIVDGVMSFESVRRIHVFSSEHLGIARKSLQVGNAFPHRSKVDDTWGLSPSLFEQFSVPSEARLKVLTREKKASVAVNEVPMMEGVAGVLLLAYCSIRRGDFKIVEEVNRLFKLVVKYNRKTKISSTKQKEHVLGKILKAYLYQDIISKTQLNLLNISVDVLKKCHLELDLDKIIPKEIHSEISEWCNASESTDTEKDYLNWVTRLSEALGVSGHLVDMSQCPHVELVALFHVLKYRAYRDSKTLFTLVDNTEQEDIRYYMIGFTGILMGLKNAKSEDKADLIGKSYIELVIYNINKKYLSSKRFVSPELQLQKPFDGDEWLQINMKFFGSVSASAERRPETEWIALPKQVRLPNIKTNPTKSTSKQVSETSFVKKPLIEYIQ